MMKEETERNCCACQFRRDNKCAERGISIKARITRSATTCEIFQKVIVRPEDKSYTFSHELFGERLSVDITPSSDNECECAVFTVVSIILGYIKKRGSHITGD